MSVCLPADAKARFKMLTEMLECSENRSALSIRSIRMALVPSTQVTAKKAPIVLDHRIERQR